MRNRRLPRLALCLAFLVLVQGVLTDFLRRESLLGKLPENAWETEEFRQLSVSKDNIRQMEEFSQNTGISFADCLAVQLVAGDFVLEKPAKLSEREFRQREALLEKHRKEEFGKLQESCEALFSDLVYFPVAYLKGGGSGQIFYENGYGAPRNYGGERTHEGIDLFGQKDESGYYPVVSVTDGVVENVGWLPLGGYRIGIRSPHGAYFYYAHLEEYGARFEKGDRVTAGELLGLMGDTGYGQEGTSGKFPVHLHFGVYLRTEHFREMSVNPYAILTFLENKTREYTY